MASERIESETELGVLSWNLFHGRDHPPDPALLTLRSRLLRISERNSTHVQVNRDLVTGFAELIANWSWDVALLQECPPHWRDPLARACGAESMQSLTSRNSWTGARRLLARLNPDLIGSNEGGSNLLLIRGGVGSIADRRELVLTPGPRPERRTMALARLASGLCVAGLHASAGIGNRASARRQVMAAAETALDWADGKPLVLGGDFNLRPRESDAFAELERRFGLSGITSPSSIDHILSSGLEILEAPRALAPAEREVPDRTGLAIRLSDHAPVLARFSVRGKLAATPAERG